MGKLDLILPENLDKSIFDQWFDERFETRMAERAAAHVPSLAIIATKGTLDWAYPPFILASTASALGWDVSVFFTFYGLELLKKDLHLEVSPLGNPSMPMKMPFGPQWFKDINWKIPNLVMAGMPGFEKVATGLMQQTVKNNGVASIEELRSICIEADVKLVACQMTVELFGHSHDDFIPEIKDWIGAASFLPVAQKSDVCLFI
ncbi:MAG: NADH-quinone oxidoreductase subunit F [Hydrogenophilales bacterium 32-62-9]|nr:MAG: NADH-quinone oxidoreductase subunit F [Hydrogenophilales bacterium 32-62-9]